MAEAAVAAAPQTAAKSSKTVELSTAQKAAAVIIALGAEKASLLYKFMEDEEVEQLTLEVARLGVLTVQQTEDILNEFYQLCLTNKAVTEGGLEYARAVLEKAYGEQAAAELLGKVTKSLKNREFAFMDKADIKSLYSALRSERPQTIALVLSYVDADKAAGVVAQLDEKKQIQVVESIAKLDSVSPAAIKIVEAEMHNRFSNIMTDTNIKVGGIDYVADVMNNLDRTSEKNIFDGLSDPRDLVLALKAANAEVANKLFANMSSRMAQSIKDDLEITSNVRMKDVEEAQQRIVGIIRGLEEKGEIIILKGGKDDIIA